MRHKKNEMHRLSYLNSFPSFRKWINTCVYCQKSGYNPEMPKVVTIRGYGHSEHPTHIAKTIRYLYQPMAVDEFGRCDECRKALEKSDELQGEYMIEEFTEFLKEKGWKIEKNNEKGDSASNTILSGYGELPTTFIELIENYKSIISGEDTKWFLCINDYNGESEYAFKWNEFELMSLEAATGDEEWENEIKDWWRTKLPFMLSVSSDYSYYAIDTEKGGAIVNGWAPEFEETTEVAENFEVFLRKIMDGEILI